MWHTRLFAAALKLCLQCTLTHSNVVGNNLTLFLDLSLMVVQVSFDAAFTACASRRFAEALSAPGSYSSLESVIEAAQRIWWSNLGVQDWLEAFAAHPVIGDAGGACVRANSEWHCHARTCTHSIQLCCLRTAPNAMHAAAALERKFSGTAFGAHSSNEQAAALTETDPRVFEELAALNASYREKHGFIFIVCAADMSAVALRDALRARLPNSTYAELGAAATEQIKITVMRLERQLGASSAASGNQVGGSSAAAAAARRTEQLAGHLVPQPAAGNSGALRSPITTHVLDTALGRPAQGLPISLHRLMPGSQRMWTCLSAGHTDADGRVSNLLAPAASVQEGTYQMRFDTGTYLRACRYDV